MTSLNLYVVVVCVLNIKASGYAASCNDQQKMVNGRCCNLCQPGQYAVKECSAHQQTICSPCPEGSFANKSNMLDRCEMCHSCQQEYTENCKSTTNAKCSCRSGFLCSSSICSECVENKCVAGEKLITTHQPYSHVILYTHRCEPICPDDNTYFDEKNNTCKRRTQCRVELFPGDKTHDSICQPPDMLRGAGDSLRVILSVAVVLLSFSFLVFFSYVCAKNIKKLQANRDPDPDDTAAVSTNPSDLHLSKEESGLQLIIQDEVKAIDS